MKTSLFAMLALSVVGNTSAQPGKHPYSMTGDMLIRKHNGPPGLGNAQLRGDDYLEHLRARGYLDGIKDATEGREWCYRGRFKPDELDADLVADLARLPPAARRSDAAPLVLAALRMRFPCSNAVRSAP